VSRAAPGRRMAGAALAALAGIAAAAASPVAQDRSEHGWNVIVVLTDDQRWDTVDAMPWLASELRRPGSGWTTFPEAFANTPLCCPARASLLTGRYARHTGVERNIDGGELDESSTLATWFSDAGYRTGLIGKYLNGYPFGRIPYVPPGWDRFVAKLNQSGATVYRDFAAVDQTSQLQITGAYATDWLAERAVGFVRTTPPARPLFLLFAPSAPHPPWVPGRRHAGTFADVPAREPPNVAGALRGAPPWVRSLAVPSTAQRAIWLDERRRADETLLAVDDALRALTRALDERLDETFIFVLSDNGYSFGEHRWEGKRCPYEACVRIPLAIHAPGDGALAGRAATADAGTLEPVVSIVDMAPTILTLAGVAAPDELEEMDGERFAAWPEPQGTTAFEPRNEAVFLEWAGDREIPAWTAVRTVGLKLIRYADGFEELYDIEGRIGPPDPWETRNRAGDPRYRPLLDRLRALLDGYAGAGAGPG
jgi:N-acetylglucosamine-6-sulfatase